MLKPFNHAKDRNAGVRFSLLFIFLFFYSCQEDVISPDSLQDPVSAVGDAVTISNPGFESNWSGWNDTDPSSISGDANTGSKSAKITGSGGRFDQQVSVKANTDYTLSAYVLGGWRIGAEFGSTRKTRSGSTSSWKKESVTFNTGSSTTITILGEFRTSEGRFDDFELIEGEGSGGGATPGCSLPWTENTITVSNQTFNYSETIDISCATSVTLSMNASGVGSMESSDYINIYYKIDGGAQQTLYSKTDSFAELSLSQEGIQGNSLELIIEAKTSASNETYTVSNILISESSGSGGGGSTYTSIPAKIEAENFDDASEGRTENTSDTGGGLNVGWIDAGEFLSYDVAVPSSGSYTIDFRVASLSAGVSFDIYQGNTKIGDLSAASTGGWQNWITVSETVSLSSGNQTIKIQATGGGWNINWLEFKSGGSTGGGGTGNLDPSKNPSGNFDLSTWKITGSDGADRSVSQLNSSSFNIPDQFFTASDGGMVFKNYPAGPNTGTTSGATQYSRVELREMLRGTNTSIPTKGINQNNWVFSSSSTSNENAAGGVDGVMTATLKVDRVTTAAGGSNTKVGRIVIGQIHASDNEPIRLYYKLMPGTTKGAIYFIHEDANGNEFAVNMIGTYAKTGANNAGDFSGASEPANGIPLGEAFSYKIEVIGNMLFVDIIRDGNPTVSEQYDMSSSGYANDWMYFKAGLYSQNDQAESASDYEQVTFYALQKSHN